LVRGTWPAEWGQDEITVASLTSGVRLESKVKVSGPSYGGEQYYRMIADPESARRVIGVIDAAQRSAQLGQSVAPAPGCE
jgi:hypothetical protein